MKYDPFIQSRLAEIKTLDAQIWERRCPPSAALSFLEALAKANPGAADELKAAQSGAFLASRFHYFGESEVRALLRTAFRSIYIPYCQKRGAASVPDIERVVSSTRFLGLGSPAKSSVHLLYPFRQENRLPDILFPSLPDLFVGNGARKALGKGHENVNTLAFVDDFAGTGKTLVKHIKRLRTELDEFRRKSDGGKVILLLLVATTQAVETITESGLVDYMETVLLLDESYKVFGDRSRYFQELGLGLPFSENDAKRAFSAASAVVGAKMSAGFGGAELMLAFSHNTPNNTVRVFWSNANKWSPLFRRHSPPLWGK